MRRLVPAIVLVLGAAFVAAGCSDDDDTAAPTTTTRGATTASTPTSSNEAATSSSAAATSSSVGTTSSTAAASEFCTTVREAVEETENTSTGSTIDRGDLRASFDRLAAAAPPDLQDDFATVDRALDAIGDLDDATIDDLQRAFAEVPDVLGAIQAITTDVRDQCDVELDVVDQIFGELGGRESPTATT
jgi:hypothetical protein